MGKIATVASFLLGVLALVAPGEALDLPVTDGGWALEGPSVKVAKEDGRDAIAIETGVAYRRDVRLGDGTVEFDVKLTRRRSFVYVMFRMQDDREYEEMYLRPHKSNLPDAIQYAPVYQGQSAWQLYHGPGATAAVELPPAWVHVRLVLQGSRAALFVGNEREPALVVPRLAREPRAGYLAIRGFVPRGTPGEGPCAWYSDLRVFPGRTDFDFTSVAPPPPSGAGTVREWAVSAAFAPAVGGLPSPPDQAAVGPYRRVETEPSGLLEMHRYVKVPAGGRETTAAARVHVVAEKDGLYVLDLGWSDEATVFLDGRPLFRGEAAYSFDNPRRDGLIGYDQARLFLPLRAGDNELLVVVEDGFGGMGLMARFPDPSGLRLEAR
jgi:hypothetical protein